MTLEIAKLWYANSHKFANSCLQFQEIEQRPIRWNSIMKLQKSLETCFFCLQHWVANKSFIVCTGLNKMGPLMNAE